MPPDSVQHKNGLTIYSGMRRDSNPTWTRSHIGPVALARPLGCESVRKRCAFGTLVRPVQTEFISGRRRYLCQKFPVASSSTTSLQEGAIAILLERSTPQFDGARIAVQFHLSQREKETMELLVHGLTSKEIAHRMEISPNTVKAFLRLIMVKMSVTTRSGLVARVFGPI